MSTISEIRKDYFDGGGNLTRGSRVGSDEILEELLNQVKFDIIALETGSSPAILYVDKSYTGTVELGSLTNPYKTVQAALDAVTQNSTVKIAPGVYNEALIYNGDFTVCLDGNSGYLGSNGVRIDPVGLGAPGLTVTNSTLAGLTTYRTSGIYSDLVNKGSAGCSVFGAKNVSFRGDTDESCIELLGVKGDVDPNTTAFLLGMGFVAERMGLSARGGAYKGIYAKNVYSMLMYSSVGNGSVNLFNVANYQGWHNVDVRLFTGEYDATSPDGQPQYGYLGTVLYYSNQADLVVNQGIALHAEHSSVGDIVVNSTGDIRLENSFVDGDLTLNGTGAFAAKDLTIDGNLDINGASGGASALGITIGGNLTMTVGKTATLNAPHIAGNVTLDNGAGAVVLNGGEYMGALTDVGGRLTRNVGS